MLRLDVSRSTDPKQNRPSVDIPRENQIMVVSHIFPLLFLVLVRLVFHKEGPKMFFYFKKVKSFQILSEKSSGRAESNNVAPVSWIQKGKKAEGRTFSHMTSDHTRE